MIGLIPAAGRARRLGPLPCSKELLPIAVEEGREPPVRVLARHLLDSLALAGVERAVMVIDPAKRDLVEYLGEGGVPGPKVAFVLKPGSASVPETLDAAYPLVGGSVVALGFADVLFAPTEAFTRLLARYADGGADLVLGLFPATDCGSTDMVELGPEGRVLAIEVRPPQSALAHNWLLAVWGPRFSRFLHETVAGLDPACGEVQLGDLFRRALAAGLEARGVAFPDGRWLDVGTPAALALALRHGGLPPG